ncbi:hypothetical protein [Neobacillus sp. FSL H8-0543]|uniref:hypothetical protein n=1 Tax=Neobacillus sp. FSL H8-0543 TaxID=2954672 RepID=UPI0031595225
MIIETRKTAAGTEYWDNVEKRVIFVPTNKEPDFEVTVYPMSMLLGVDLANGPDKTAVNGQVVDSNTDIDLDVMNKEQLLVFAKQNDIDIPGNMKKVDTIRNHIAEILTAVDE